MSLETQPPLPSGLGVALSPPHLMPNGLASPPSLPGLRPQLLPPTVVLRVRRTTLVLTGSGSPRPVPERPQPEPSASQLERLGSQPCRSPPRRPLGLRDSPFCPLQEALEPWRRPDPPLPQARLRPSRDLRLCPYGLHQLGTWGSVFPVGPKPVWNRQTAAAQPNSCPLRLLLLLLAGAGQGLQPIARSPAYRGGWAL